MKTLKEGIALKDEDSWQDLLTRSPPTTDGVGRKQKWKQVTLGSGFPLQKIASNRCSIRWSKTLKTPLASTAQVPNYRDLTLAMMSEKQILIILPSEAIFGGGWISFQVNHKSFSASLTTVPKSSPQNSLYDSNLHAGHKNTFSLPITQCLTCSRVINTKWMSTNIKLTNKAKVCPFKGNPNLSFTVI